MSKESETAGKGRAEPLGTGTPLFPLTGPHPHGTLNRAAGLDFLLAAPNPDGGWGYKRGGMSYVEPTAAALLALESAGQRTGSAFVAGASWLLRLQQADGGWGIAAIDAESGWMTAWSAWALARIDTAAAARGGDWLRKTENLRATNAADMEAARRLLKIDASLRAWPWQSGDAAWVFPTALALLAFHALGQDSQPRVQEGIRFLIDRAIASGGWNIGNPAMLNAELAPTVISTALVLRALTALGIAGEVVTRGAAWLAADLAQARTSPELAWGVWGLASFAFDLTNARERLQARQRADGSWDGNPLTTAIALLAEG